MNQIAMNAPPDSLTASRSIYRREEWLLFRKTCLELSGKKCERCSKTYKETSLQVHHPHYGENLMPWEYEPKFCEVLCKGCHAREHGKIKPIEGWVLVHSDWEYGHSTGLIRCEHCDSSMEWHNDLWHPEWGIITVGYECADKLGVPEVHALKRKRERMNTFIHSPRWKQTAKGFRYSYGERVVFVMAKCNGWILKIGKTWGKRTYATINSAKESAFLFIESAFKSTQTQQNKDSRLSTMPQPPRPPELREMQRSPHWKALEPILKTGFDDARRGHWGNHHPARTLRWYAYEAGWDEGDNLNQRELASQRKPS